jgi:hypothetical protein
MQERHPAAMKRARRRLIDRLSLQLQLHLFEHCSKGAALVLAELKTGLDKLRTARERAERKA